MNIEFIAHNVLIFVFASIAISSVSLTITKAEVFSWFRNLFELNHDNFNNFLRPEEGLNFFGKIKSFFSGLFNCPYCISHWISGIFVLFYHPRIIDNFYVNYILLTMTFVGICSLVSAKIYKEIKSIE